MEKRKDTFLLLGATGDLGAEILKRLASINCDIICIARGDHKRTYQERVTKIINEQNITEAMPRISAWEGDLCAPRIGLNEADYSRLTHSVTYIIHAAADTRFNQPLSDIRRVNVYGTEQVLELAEKCRRCNPNFKMLGWVGTAYVAGRRKGVALEHELTDRFGFNNTYEQSKYEAEILIRDAIGLGLPAIIFRPSVILGASQNGEFKPSSVLYPMIVLYSKLLPKQILPTVRGACIDIVPLDFVTKSILYLLLRPENRGMCFHLAAGEGRSIDIDRHFAKAIIDGLRLPKIRFLPIFLWLPVMLLARIFKLDIYKRFIKLRKMNQMGGYSEYVHSSNLEFSVTETKKALEGSGISMPEPIELLKACVEYARLHYVQQRME